MFLRRADVGQRMFDVAAALWRVFDAALVSGQQLESFEGFIQRDPASGGAVENASRTLGGGSRTGQQVRRDCIVDKGKVATGFAVAENRGLFSTEHLHAEFCEHAGIGRRRVLPGSEDVEVTQAHGFEAVAAK